MKSKIIISLSSNTVEANGTVGLDEGVIKSAWPHLGDGEKRDWLDKNPDSKAHKFEDRPEPEPESEPEPNSDNKKAQTAAPDSEQNWWDKLSADEQDDYLQRHPKSRRRKTNVRGGLIRHAILKSSNRVHHAVRLIGKSYRRGMRGLRNMRVGKPMSGAEREGLKKTGLVVATVVVAALVAAALFTPLGGIALDVSTDYLSWLHEQYNTTGQASNVSAGSDTDRATLTEFHDGMVKWLLAQSPQKLIERYGKKA